MKKKSLLFATTALLIFPINTVVAESDTGMSGYIEIGARLADGEDEGAKFMEYEDLDSGFIGNLVYNYYRDAFFFDIDAENIGLNNQSYRLQGGDYNSYKFGLFYDETPHNISYDAKTFYSGLGSGRLFIGTLSPSNESTWRTFDYSVDTTRYGADAEFLRGSPFFLDIKVNREEKEGLRPLASGGFAGAVEMPESVDSETDTFSVSGGYRGETFSFQLSGMFSSFDKDQNALEWENPFNGAIDHNSLAQDSDYGKLSTILTWRQLPMMSTLMVKGSYTNLSSDYATTDLGAALPTSLNTTAFEGDITTTRFSAALASSPLDKLDTRLYFDYFDRDNDSTVITYSDGSNDIHLFSYSKFTAGLDVDYRLSSHTKLSGGYEFEDVDRTNRHDAESNRDNLVFIKLKNTSLDFLTVKLEYSYLDRDTDEVVDMTLTPFDAAYINRFVDRFDATSKSRHTFKVDVELYPSDSVNVGASYSYVINDYDDVVLGRTEDTGHELYLDVSWDVAEMLTINGFAGYERYEEDSNHYNHRAGFLGQTADPTIEDGSSASFRWSQFVEEDFWTIGASAKIPLMSNRLMLSLLCQYQESDGYSGFTTEGTSALESIDEFDDYYITTVEAKASYAISETIGVSVGYLYEKTNYEDLQYDNYDYSPSGTYLTGANADNDYEAHVGYVTVKYSF